MTDSSFFAQSICVSIRGCAFQVVLVGGWNKKQELVNIINLFSGHFPPFIWLWRLGKQSHFTVSYTRLSTPPGLIGTNTTDFVPCDCGRVINVADDFVKKDLAATPESGNTWNMNLSLVPSATNTIN